MKLNNEKYNKMPQDYKSSGAGGISCMTTDEMEVLLKSNQSFKVKEIKNNFNIPNPSDLSNNTFKVIVLELSN